MSNSIDENNTKNKKNPNFDEAQNNQSEVGAAGDDPSTVGPADPTRDEVAKTSDGQSDESST
jgi:hypothetical protein